MSSKPIALRRTAPDAQPVTTIEASDYTISINGTSVNPSNISWVSSVTMAAPSTSNIYFGKLPSFYNSNISSINPCYDILIGDFVVLNKNHEYDSWDNTGSDFYNKGPPTECLSVGGDAIIENKLGIGTVSPAYELDVVGDINCTGTLSKGSGSFKIDHPLEIMSNTHNLYHSFIEGPKADLMYRGKVDLVNGSASINLDTVSNMTSGTFEVLNRNVQCFTSNESDWDAVKGSVSGNMLTISCQNESSTAKVSWLVIGERKDKHMYDTEWTDDDGHVVPEKAKST